ncbi:MULTISPECIES: hypothetical protein [unclassified Pseudomonas]|uniref:hypothetical protein n=1 Tax=unclassified Pseudomonas TaxID=196821 RepID=UPI001CBA87EF|nr:MULTISPECIES: hypothetical protein [unclassified Pseudomonas]
MPRFPDGTTSHSADTTILNLVKEIKIARENWQNTASLFANACDDVWLSKMGEIERLESHYRSLQDQLCHHIEQSFKVE